MAADGGAATAAAKAGGFTPTVWQIEHVGELLAGLGEASLMVTMASAGAALDAPGAVVLQDAPGPHARARDSPARLGACASWALGSAAHRGATLGVRGEAPDRTHHLDG